MANIKVTDKVITSITRERNVNPNELCINGIYRLEHFRNGELIGKRECSNTVTTEGKRYLLDAALYNSTGGYAEKTAWYVALINNNNGAKNGGSPVAPAVTQTYDAFFDTVNTEFQAYSGGARPAWTGVLDVGGLAKITNIVSKASFTFSGPGTLYGACLVSNSTLAGSEPGHHVAGDYLLSFAYFGAPATIPVIALDVLNVEVELVFS
jgi:hypothetical protein